MASVVEDEPAPGAQPIAASTAAAGARARPSWQPDDGLASSGSLRGLRNLSLRWSLVLVGAFSFVLAAILALASFRGLDRVGAAAAREEASLEAQLVNSGIALARAELRADALEAAGTTDVAPDDAAETVEAHEAQLRAGVDELKRFDLPPALEDERARLATSLAAFANQTEDVVRLAMTDHAAAESQLAALEKLHAQLVADQQALNDRLAAEHDAADAALDHARHAVARIEVLTTATVLGALAAVTLGLNGVGLRYGRLLAHLRAETTWRRFGGELADALDMVDSEHGAYGVIERAMEDISPGRPVELVLADSSVAHLEQVASSPSGAPGCPVQSPWHCPAVRRARPITFDSSETLSACPKLRQRESGPRSAVCVPVSFMGRALGVLHTTGPDGAPPSQVEVERLTMLAAQAGSRIGTLRAFARAESQASTDGLTGLANRRALEDHVGELLRRQEPFAVVLADVDHFKDLNDTFGHEAGDRALRVFTHVLQDSIRRGDMAARIGGEEFAVILPGLDVSQAVDVLDRHRRLLAEALTDGTCPRFTVSFGVTDSRAGERLEDLLRAADRALYLAKEQGRDRVVVDEHITA